VAFVFPGRAWPLDCPERFHCTVNDFLPTVPASLSTSNTVWLVPRCGAPVTHALNWGGGLAGGKVF
jgi:hypothetical protein